MVASRSYLIDSVLFRVYLIYTAAKFSSFIMTEVGRTTIVVISKGDRVESGSLRVVPDSAIKEFIYVFI